MDGMGEFIQIFCLFFFGTSGFGLWDFGIQIDMGTSME
jgi:hypothetical protein